MSPDPLAVAASDSMGDLQPIVIASGFLRCGMATTNGDA